jgi:hypothetical protein
MSAWVSVLRDTFGLCPFLLIRLRLRPGLSGALGCTGAHLPAARQLQVCRPRAPACSAAERIECTIVH